MATKVLLPPPLQWILPDGAPSPVFYRFILDFYNANGGGGTFGTAALENIGVAGANVPLLSAGNEWSGVQSFVSGTLRLEGLTSGAIFLVPQAVAAGTVTFPNGTTQLVGRDTVDTLTNKTFDTANNVAFKINGTAISDKTGTGKVVLDTSPTLTTPTLGAAAATTINKVTFTAPATGSTLTISDGKTLTVTDDVSIGKGQYQGTATNDNAAAGNIGQFIESEILVAGGVALTTGTPADVTSLALTAGDWEVGANIAFAFGGTTTVTQIAGWTSLTSATLPTYPNKGSLVVETATLATGADQVRPVGSRRLSLAAPATVYLSGLAAFAISTAKAYGYLWARRVR